MSDMDGTASVAAKLDVLIRLQAISIMEKFGTQREKIAFLSKAGLSPKVIADMLGTTPNSVSVALAKMRKGNGNDAEGKD